MMQAAALRMPDDDGAGAGILEHFRREVAREGAGRLGMAVLCSDRHPGAARKRGKACDQGRGRAHQEVGLGVELARAPDDLQELGPRRPQAVHLPVAGNERPRRHGVRLFEREG
jgi:hypothetical protein